MSAVDDLLAQEFVCARCEHKGGHVERTLHNPFGNGFNVILVGGSDLAGVRAATAALIAKLTSERHTKDDLSLGWTMQIRLGKGVQVPKDIELT